MFNECGDLRFRDVDLESKVIEIDRSFICCNQFYKRQKKCEDMARSWRGATLRSKKYGVRVFGCTTNNGHLIALSRYLIASRFHGLLYVEIYSV